MIPSAIFREYDIRGVAGKDLAGDTAVLIGKAFSSLVKSFIPKAKQVSVGRDVRLSSEELAAGLIKGIVSSGIDVYDIGVCPTPVQYFSLHHLDLDGGIMVTGSHNPPEYNGFKISIGKDAIYGGNIQKLEEIIKRQDWTISEEDGRVKHCNIIDPYKEYMLKQFSYLNNARFRRVRVPRIIPMLWAMDSSTGPTTSLKSMLRSRLWLISNRSKSS